MSPESPEASEEGEKFDGVLMLQRSPSQVAKHSILFYRNMVVQNMGGLAGHKEHQQKPREFKGSETPRGTDEPVLNLESVEAMGKGVTKVLLKSPELSVLESAGEARVQVIRMHGDPNSTLHVHFTCKDDTAVAGLDYHHTEGVLTFGPGEEVKEIAVPIVDDDMSEPDVIFNILLTEARLEGDGEVALLRRQMAVTIVDDDDGGIVMFELPTWEAGLLDQYATIVVIRRNGADGKVSIDYTTKSGSALSGEPGISSGS